MTFLVPYDGSELAAAALVRADEYADAVDEDVTAVTVVLASTRYAREKVWVDVGEPFQVREVIGGLHRQVHERSPEASFRSERVVRSATGGTVANVVRRVAKDVDASVVFLGSENAGRIVVPVSSVGGSVAADASYDVHVVRRREPPTIDSMRYRSGFYLTE